MKSPEKTQKEGREAEQGMACEGRYRGTMTGSKQRERLSSGSLFGGGNQLSHGVGDPVEMNKQCEYRCQSWDV
eukprot:scaffold4223_cov189-Amphora_coffeaeformis.AAC.22